MGESILDQPSFLARFDVIVLAAGASRRFPNGNKLIAPYGGRPLISHILRTVERLDVHRRIIVTGPPYRRDILAVLRDHPGWHEVFNADAGDGMGASIAAGAAHLAGSEGVFICPGDMPGMQPLDFHAVATLSTGAESICRPSFAGQLGHPVLFGQAYYDHLRTLTGIWGARGLMDSFASRVVSYEADDARVVKDFDRPDDFA